MTQGGALETVVSESEGEYEDDALTKKESESDDEYESDEEDAMMECNPEIVHLLRSALMDQREHNDAVLKAHKDQRCDQKELHSTQQQDQKELHSTQQQVQKELHSAQQQELARNSTNLNDTIGVLKMLASPRTKTPRKKIRASKPRTLAQTVQRPFEDICNQPTPHPDDRVETNPGTYTLSLSCCVLSILIPALTSTLFSFVYFPEHSESAAPTVLFGETGTVPKRRTVKAKRPIVEVNDTKSHPLLIRYDGRLYRFDDVLPDGKCFYNCAAESGLGPHIDTETLRADLAK